MGEDATHGEGRRRDRRAELGLRVEFRATAASRPAGSTPRSTWSAGRKGFILVSDVHVGMTERHRGHRGRDERSSCTARSTCCTTATHRDPARRPALPAPRRRGRRPGADPPDARRPDRRVLRAPRPDVAQFNRLGFPKPLSGARFVRDLGAVRARRAPEPEDAAADRARRPQPRRPRVRVRRRVARRCPARGRLRRARRRPDLPPVVEAGLHRRPRRRRVHASALQGPAPVPPAHAHEDGPVRASARPAGRDRRRPARHRHLDARLRARAAAPTCASTGACTPTASCSAR